MGETARCLYPRANPRRHSMYGGPPELWCDVCHGCRQAKTGRWWRYAVVRGRGIPTAMDGKWYDLDMLPTTRTDKGQAAIVEFFGSRVVLHATNQWEQRGRRRSCCLI